MHDEQKLWPQGVETGLVKTSKQIEQVNCSSDRNSPGNDIVCLKANRLIEKHKIHRCTKTRQLVAYIHSHYIDVYFWFFAIWNN